MNHGWGYKRLIDICQINFGKRIVAKETQPGPYYVYGGGGATFTTKDYNRENCMIISRFAMSPECVRFVHGRFFLNDSGLSVSLNCDTLTQEFVDKYLWANQSKIYSLGRGAAQKNLNTKSFSELPIPVPEVETQVRIVSELDKINELIAVKRSQLKDLDALAQSLFYETFSSIEETVPLSFYVKALVGGKSLASKEVSPNKVLKSGAVTYDYFDKNSTKYLPVDYIPDSEHSVSTGDLIISRMNTAELVGACAYVFDVDDNVYLPDRLWRIEYKSNANPIYLWKSLISESAKWQIRSKASGTSGSMKNISKPLLLSINIKKVPISIQQQFAERIEAIEAQKKLVEASIADLETLLASRMDYWFND